MSEPTGYDPRNHAGRYVVRRGSIAAAALDRWRRRKGLATLLSESTEDDPRNRYGRSVFRLASTYRIDGRLGSSCR